MSQAPRVLHVCGRLGAGGVTRFIEAILSNKGASDSQHDLLLTFADGPPPRGSGYAVYRLDYGPRGALACMRDAWHIYRGYDGVMVHGAHPVAVLPLVAAGSRVLVFQHGMSLGGRRAWVRAAKRLWFSLLPEILGARVVCSTEFAFRKSVGLGVRLRRSRRVIVPFGTLSEEWLEPRGARHGGWNSDRASLTVGMAGRLDRQKRHRRVIDSLRGYPGPRRIRLRIAGDGPERASLEAAAATVEGEWVTVELLGPVEDMKSFYDELDLLAFPSHEESFGLVVLEAFSRGVPVVVFPDVGGCLPLIRDGETGFVLGRGRVPDLQSLWALLGEDASVLPALRQALALRDFSAFSVAATRATLDLLAMGRGPAGPEA